MASQNAQARCQPARVAGRYQRKHEPYRCRRIPTRAEILQDTLALQANNWQAQLANDFDLKRYAFDERLRNVTGFGDSPLPVIPPVWANPCARSPDAIVANR